MTKKIIWIVVETPWEGKSGEFFIHGPYASLEAAERHPDDKNKVYDYIPLDVTNLEIQEI